MAIPGETNTPPGFHADMRSLAQAIPVEIKFVGRPDLARRPPFGNPCDRGFEDVTPETFARDNISYKLVIG